MTSESGVFLKRALPDAPVRQDGPVTEACVGGPGDALRLYGLTCENGKAVSVMAALVAPGLLAEHRVWSSYWSGFADLIGFFRSLARDWRGWQGERTFRAMENDLHIVATHAGHVRLAVQLGPGADVDGWIATTVIELDPGEQLTQVADEVEALLGADR
jgi:hypothetical protein